MKYSMEIEGVFMCNPFSTYLFYATAVLDVNRTGDIN